jgi:tRNA(Arg) A34 adenosine deaminase TadA
VVAETIGSIVVAVTGGSIDQVQTFERAWQALPAAASAALAGAFRSLTAGGLAVGSALADGTGAVVATGRNRAYDPPGGPEPLQGTPLAHAEMNTLAAVPTSRELSADTLWSTQQPCAMCDAAAVFCGVGTVAWLAPDPWAIADEVSTERAAAPTVRVPPTDHRWLVVANALFVASIVRTRGRDHPTPTRNAEREPETDRLVDPLIVALTADPDLLALLGRLWSPITEAAAARSARDAG